MAAYILVDITIHDRQTYERFKLLVEGFPGA